MIRKSTLAVTISLLCGCGTVPAHSPQPAVHIGKPLDSAVSNNLPKAMTDRVFAALSDPTRRQVFERLAERPQTVGALAAQFPVSRPAISQHLRVLKDAGLVTDEAKGTSRIYRIDPNGLGPVRQWLDQQWARSLESFRKLAEEEPKS
jgi:DNA-binding transcriptional ArsR family regulator